ncbi:unnamed protein product [Ectocarpus sp. CCAP 1310/34]|nr:unnamed protein product [Ectocarpus sp. CCAP 1310/34]
MWNSWATMWKSWITNPRARLPPQSSLQRPDEMWCDGLAGKIAEAEAREQAKREDAERLAEREAALAAAARKQEESVRLFGLLRRGSRRRNVRLLWLLRRGSRRRSVRLFWRSVRGTSKRRGRSRGRSDRG